MTENQPRPAWKTALAVVCALTVAVTMTSDFFVPAARWTEVWFGFEVKGWPALLSAPIHWSIFATGAYGFWNQRSWAAPGAAGYLFYAAFAHAVWSEASPHGRGIAIGLLEAAAISGLALLILRQHRRESAQ